MLEQEHRGTLERLIEGGLPQLVAGPAGKAISRLIGAGFDIPVEWLEGVSQGMRDRKEARSQISRALADRASQLAVDDPAIMERALQSMLGKQYRRQQNKEAVARIAVEHLHDDPACSADEGPSEDWMNAFERHAEDASSEKLREMFGRLLAGEIKSPGTVSRASLQMLSTLDDEESQLIKRVLPLCDNSGIFFLDCMKPQLRVVDVTMLEQAGFWTGEKILPLTGRKSLGVDTRGESAVFLQFEEGSVTGTLQIALLSRAGKDLRNAVDIPFDHDALAKRLLSLGAVNLRKTTLKGNGSGATVSEEALT